ncbi:MAG: SMC family ATPase [SAR202 cluster bacterium]|nr:SMC family ATPase [SAR202 cluster bacterium]
MIPLRLTVKNFMCYRDNAPTLDLEGIHVACLCGENGHGKSALLDAMTWALWGEARASTQDELIHLGQQDMVVDLEFLARDHRYRVTRSHVRAVRGRQGKTDLSLLAASNGRFTVTSGNTVADTQKRIRDLLQMDYTTFINTAFLLQGRADLFTMSRSSERKERLGEVLGLAAYDALEERAKLRSRERHQRVLGLDALLASRREELARRPQFAEEMAAVKAELGRLTPALEEARRTRDAAYSRRDELLSRRAQADESDRRLTGERQETARLEKLAQEHAVRVQQFEALLVREAEISDRFQAYESARGELERFTHALARLNKLAEEKAPLERAIADQGGRLQAEGERLRDTLERDLAPKAARFPQLERELEVTLRELAGLGEEEKAIEALRVSASDSAGKAAALEQTSDGLTKEMAEARSKAELLLQPGAACPVCKQALGPEGQAHLRSEYRARYEAAKQSRDQAEAQLKVARREQQGSAARAEQLFKALNQKSALLHRRVEGLERELRESRQALDALEPARRGLAHAEARLRSNDFAHEQRDKLADLEARSAELGYNQEAHRRTQGEARSLEQYADLHRQLVDAKGRLPSEQKALQDTSGSLERRRQEVKRLDEARQALQRDLQGFADAERGLAAAQRSLMELEAGYGKALQRHGALEASLARCDAVEAEARQLEVERRQEADEKAVYDELAGAFGKNGIQALIIETAIPQLEADSNELLSRLTDGRMHLKLELRQGAVRRGTTAEELEVKIADEVGTRSYETFSGGEGFRINFALRIALSKLLARRSGAPLPILFIDEGFGSQDSAGQERLKEAIQSIQDDFKKILVITHVEEVKEAFPVRIEVTKTPLGSTFTIV